MPPERPGSASHPHASHQQRPGEAPLTERSSLIVAARKLHGRNGRGGRVRQGRFLAEGAQAAREALHWHVEGRGRVHQVFATRQASDRHASLLQRAVSAGIATATITDRASSALTETVTPQGIFATCDLVERPLPDVLDDLAAAELVVVLCEISDPGNAGSLLRLADAVAADAVVLAGDSVDAHNGKCVRASVGSLFHVPVARCPDVSEALRCCRAAGLRMVGADGAHGNDLFAQEAMLSRPTAWVFGNEAHGIPGAVLEGLDATVAVPIHGHAESLNLATAAAVCLYASSRAQRG